MWAKEGPVFTFNLPGGRFAPQSPVKYATGRDPQFEKPWVRQLTGQSRKTGNTQNCNNCNAFDCGATGSG